MKTNTRPDAHGFTLIEVLIALAVIAIALTALLKATSQSTLFTERIKTKTFAHWVAMQGIASIQLGLVKVEPHQAQTQTTMMAGKKWYWRAVISPSSIQHVEKISITVSEQEAFSPSEPLIAYRYAP